MTIRSLSDEEFTALTLERFEELVRVVWFAAERLMKALDEEDWPAFNRWFAEAGRDYALYRPFHEDVITLFGEGRQEDVLNEAHRRKLANQLQRVWYERLWKLVTV